MRTIQNKNAILFLLSNESVFERTERYAKVRTIVVVNRERTAPSDPSATRPAPLPLGGVGGGPSLWWQKRQKGQIKGGYGNISRARIKLGKQEITCPTCPTRPTRPATLDT